MKPAPFAYAQAESVGHAVALLAQGAGDAVLLAGGQSLIPMLRSRLARPTLVVGIGEIERLKAIRPRASRVDIGAMVSHSVFLGWANDNGQQMLAEAAGYIGHPTVRTMGTVAGSLAHGDPSAEWGVVGLALEAICSVEGPDGRRMIAAADLWEGPFTTTLAPGEMITLVSFPLPRKGDGSCFVEVAPRHGDPAVAAVAALLLWLAPAQARRVPRRLWIAAVAIAVLAILNLVVSGQPWGIVYGLGLWAAKGATALGADVSASGFWSTPGNVERLAQPILTDVTSLTNIGLIGGAFLVSVWRGGLGAKLPRLSPLAWGAAVVAGFLLGYSSRLAFGCNVGAFFSGISTGSLHGWAWFAAAFGGAYYGIKLRPWLGLEARS